MEYSGEGNVPEQNQDFCREEEMEMEQQNPVIWVANEFENICVFAMEQSRKEKKKKPTILFDQRDSPKTKFCCFTVFCLFPYFISRATSLLSHMASAYPWQGLELFAGTITVHHPWEPSGLAGAFTLPGALT